jgi:hypothetical protein
MMECVFLADIINGQNAEMTFMRGWLVEKNYSVETRVRPRVLIIAMPTWH